MIQKYKYFIDISKNYLLIFLAAITLFFVSCSSPQDEGREAAEAYRICDQEYNNNLQKAFDQYIEEFDNYGFTTRVAARNKLNEIIENADAEYNASVLKADQNFKNLQNKYSKDPQKLLALQAAFYDQKAIIEESMLHGMPSQYEVNQKILTIIPPKPSSDKIAADLVGRKFIDKEKGYFKGWNFKIEPESVKKVSIKSESGDNNSSRYNADVELQDHPGSVTYIINFDIDYVLGDADDWTLDGVTALDVNVLKTGLYNDYITHEKDRYGNRTDFINHSDATMLIGGIYLDPDYLEWTKFSRVIRGNNYQVIYSKEYEIHFIERY